MSNNKSTGTTQQFLATLYEYYDAHGRHELPWRQPELNGSFDPYKIMVSELMLQQTQVSRVIPKYHEFLTQFPNVTTLARAELADVLVAWSGLGYNRRAKFLWQAAGTIHVQLSGKLPSAAEELVKLPGIGVNTAGAIAAYAYNRPALFIETNVRTVYLHYFLGDAMDVSDKEVLRLLSATMDVENPRLFYWALMDYGTHIKAQHGNVARRSKHYTKQSPFDGSARQVRGKILRALASKPMNITELSQLVADQRLAQIIAELANEQMVHENKGVYSLG